MIYLRAGVFAEGKSDYDFLCRLLTRLIDALAAPLFSGDYEVGDTIGIDAVPGKTGSSRAERIATAVGKYRDQFDLLVIHADGDADPEAARRTRVEPGIAAVRTARLPLLLPSVACIPVREIEAWMLADPDPFRAVLGRSMTPNLPSAPEREADPKATLERLLKEGGARRPPGFFYPLFGEQVGLLPLRTLPSFHRFEVELIHAIREVARLQGHRGGQ